MALLTGYQYYKDFPIVGSPDGTKRSYQMLLKIYRSTGQDGVEMIGATEAGKVYVGTKVDVTFKDIAFTKSDGVTVLDHFLESVAADSSYALVWIEFGSTNGGIQDLPLYPATLSYRMYYGNSLATDLSNGNLTFPFFDHFIGTILDTSKWAKSGNGNLSMLGTKVQLVGYNGAAILTGAYSQLYGALRYKAAITDNYFSYLWWVSPTDGNTRIQIQWSNITYRGLATYKAGSYISTNGSSPTWGANGTEYIHEFLWGPSVVKYLLNGALLATHTSYIPDKECKPQFYAYQQTIGAPFDMIEIDWLFIRNWTPNEPKWPAAGSWGAEQTATITQKTATVVLENKNILTPSLQCAIELGGVEKGRSSVFQLIGGAAQRTIVPTFIVTWPTVPGTYEVKVKVYEGTNLIKELIHTPITV